MKVFRNMNRTVIPLSLWLGDNFFQQFFIAASQRDREKIRRLGRSLALSMPLAIPTMLVSSTKLWNALWPGKNILNEFLSHAMSFEFSHRI